MARRTLAGLAVACGALGLSVASLAAKGPTSGSLKIFLARVQLGSGVDNDEGTSAREADVSRALGAPALGMIPAIRHS